MAESYNPDTVWPPFGAFSMAVLQGTGQIVHLKGQVSLDVEGRLVGAGDMRRQVEQVLENIETVLKGLGGKMSDVMSLVHHTTDIQAFMETGDIRATFFKEPYPVTTTVEVKSLYHPDLVIEITAVAEIPEDRFQRPRETRTLHT